MSISRRSESLMHARHLLLVAASAIALCVVTERAQAFEFQGAQYGDKQVKIMRMFDIVGKSWGVSGREKTKYTTKALAAETLASALLLGFNAADTPLKGLDQKDLPKSQSFEFLPLSPEDAQAVRDKGMAEVLDEMALKATANFLMARTLNREGGTDMNSILKKKLFGAFKVIREQTDEATVQATDAKVGHTITCETVKGSEVCSFTNNPSYYIFSMKGEGNTVGQLGPNPMSDKDARDRFMSFYAEELELSEPVGERLRISSGSSGLRGEEFPEGDLATFKPGGPVTEAMVRNLRIKNRGQGATTLNGRKTDRAFVVHGVRFGGVPIPMDDEETPSDVAKRLWNDFKEDAAEDAALFVGHVKKSWKEFIDSYKPKPKRMQKPAANRKKIPLSVLEQQKAKEEATVEKTDEPDELDKWYEQEYGGQDPLRKTA